MKTDELCHAEAHHGDHHEGIMISLTGKRIFLSAAGAGMGYSVARLARDVGAEVHATDINSQGLSLLEEEGIATSLLDVTDPQAVRRFFDSQPAFDGIVNMAGWVNHGGVLETEYADWKRSFEVNLDSMFFVLKYSLPAMIENGGGSIVNMASLASSMKGFPMRAAYSASKAGVIGLTKAVAVDHMSDNIRCNCICPGTIETPSLHGRMAQLAEKMGGMEAARNWFVSRQPMGRLGQPEEVASLILLLLSDSSAYTTGQPFVVDGGTIA